MSLLLLTGQGCPAPDPGDTPLPGSTTIRSLEVTDAVAGATGRIRVTLVDPVSSDTSVTLAGSNPAVADVPVTLTIPRGSASGTADYSAIAAGIATVTASLGASSASARVDVVTAITIESLTLDEIPTISGARVVTGRAFGVSIGLNATSAAAQIVSLASSNSSVVTVPASVTVPAETDSVALPLVASAAGTTTITAALSGASRTLDLTVVDSPSITSITVGPTLLTGSSSELLISADVSPAADTAISLASSNPAVLTLPATMVLPADQSFARLPVTVGTTGSTLLTATLGTSQATTGLFVVSQLAFQSVSIDSALEVGAIGRVSVSLNAPPPVDTTVTVTVIPAGIVSAPPSVVVPAGMAFASFLVQAIAPGEGLLGCSFNGMGAGIAINVVNAPSVVVLIGNVKVNEPSQLGVVLNAKVAADTVVTITNSNPAALTAPGSVIVPAGSSTANFTVVGVSAVPTIITAEINGNGVSTPFTPLP